MVRYNIILLQIKQLVGMNKKKYKNLWTCHLHTNNTHIILSTNQAHKKIQIIFKTKGGHWLDLILFYCK